MGPGDRTSISGHKHKKFHLNIKKYIFTVRAGEHWDQLPSCGVVVLGDTQNLLGHSLGNLLWVTLLEREGWVRVYPEVPLNLNCSVIL